MPPPGFAPALRITCIEHQQRHIGALQFGVGTAHAFALDRIPALAQAGGIGQLQLQAVDAHYLAQYVAGGAGHVGHDCARVAGQGIEQRTLARVRRTEQHRVQAIAQATAPLGLGQQALQASAQGLQVGAHTRDPQGLDRLVDEVDRRLHVDP